MRLLGAFLKLGQQAKDFIHQLLQLLLVLFSNGFLAQLLQSRLVNKHGKPWPPGPVGNPTPAYVD